MSRHKDVLDLLARSRPPQLDIAAGNAQRHGDVVARIVADDVRTADPHRHRSRRRRLVLASSVAAVAIVVAATTVIRSNGKPAYAVAAGQEGTITVTVNRVADPAAANRALQEIDNRVIIMRPTAPEKCPLADRGVRLAFEFDQVRPIGEAMGMPRSDNPLQIRLDSIPEDAVLVLIPLHDTTLVRASYASPGPTCVAESFDQSKLGPTASAPATP